MNGIDVIVAPFHAGARCSCVGAGPHRLLQAGLPDALSSTGANVATTEIANVDDCEGEIGRSFEVMRHVALAAAGTRRRGRFPLVLAGNCNVSVGVHAGLEVDCAGVVWFDAHIDFDTPDECMSGYSDGMGVATLSARCWKRLAGSIPGFFAMDLARLIYCGIRNSSLASGRRWRPTASRQSTARPHIPSPSPTNSIRCCAASTDRR